MLETKGFVQIHSGTLPGQRRASNKQNVQRTLPTRTTTSFNAGKNALKQSIAQSRCTICNHSSNVLWPWPCAICSHCSCLKSETFLNVWRKHLNHVICIIISTPAYRRKTSANELLAISWIIFNNDCLPITCRRLKLRTPSLIYFSYLRYIIISSILLFPMSKAAFDSSRDQMIKPWRVPWQPSRNEVL